MTSCGPGDRSARAAAEAAARRSYGKLVAFLAARSRDVAAAEDALSDAFAAALERWPAHGCPDNPEAWLLTVARRKMIDRARRTRAGEIAAARLRSAAEGLAEAADRAEIPDYRLALMFACAHPAIDAAVRAPLMLQAVLGLDAASIASAFLTSPAAMSQRLVRAKNRIRQAGVGLRTPEREELAARLGAVLDAIYAAFGQGWIDAAGADIARRELAQEAIYLGRLAAEMMPREPEALGLLALMLHAQARLDARRNPAGEYVPFAEQDPARWDARMIEEAEALLLRASAAGAIGRYQLEAALQSAHVYRRLSGRANWDAVLQLYDGLLELSGSPVVAVNRALALAETGAAAAALAALRELEEHPQLIEYQPYWAARAELLARTGAPGQAHRAYEIAIGLERDPAVRRFLTRRQSSLAP